VSVEVRDGSGTARFRGEVRAESIERAVQVTNARYPESVVRVVFAIESEVFIDQGGEGADEDGGRLPE
jgi:hypothetical protein